ncbi:hypothetical protein RAS1_01740 [Phycisphaerae bacterium RAS1]|nr:hypothetical protein RAS1_01740 [Phycisphaerae bacterium RAS1]
MKFPKIPAGLAAIALGALSAATALGQSQTIATFADPALDSTTPLFELNGTSFSGAWSSTGLTLLTPGLAAPDFPNAHFRLDPITLVDPVSGETTGGAVEFFDSSDALLMTLTFSEGRLIKPFSFGASDFVAQSVVIAGPIVTTPLANESFAFSFANQVLTDGGFTSTAAFTSSAVPEPASLLLLSLGGLTMACRRRA